MKYPKSQARSGRLFLKQRVQPGLGDGLVDFGFGAAGGYAVQYLSVGEDEIVEFPASSG